MKYLILILVMFLSSCTVSVEDAEASFDPRLIEIAKELCEPHNGVDYYRDDGGTQTERVICFDRTLYDIRSREVLR